MRSILLCAALLACSSAAESPASGPVPSPPPAPEPTPPPGDTGGEEPAPPIATPVPLREGETMAAIAQPASLAWQATPGASITLAWIVRAQENVRRLVLVAAHGTDRLDVIELPGEIQGQPCHRTFATLAPTQNGAVVAAQGMDRIPSSADAAECASVRTHHLIVFRDDRAEVAESWTGLPDDAGHGPAWVYPSGRPATTAPRLSVRFTFEDVGEDSSGMPRTRVSLVTEQLPAGTSETREIAVVNGACSLLDAPEERGAALQVRCWWAGAGDELILVRQGGRLVVRRAQTDEQAPRTRFRELTRIDVPREMDVEFLAIQ